MHTFRPDDTMTKEEAEAVVRRFQETAPTQARVSDVAEALGTSSEEVARLLGEVRGLTPNPRLALPREPSVRPYRLIAASVAALVLGSGLWSFAHRQRVEDTTIAIAGEASPVPPDFTATTPATATPVRPVSPP